MNQDVAKQLITPILGGYHTATCFAVLAYQPKEQSGFQRLRWACPTSRITARCRQCQKSLLAPRKLGDASPPTKLTPLARPFAQPFARFFASPFRIDFAPAPRISIRWALRLWGFPKHKWTTVGSKVKGGTRAAQEIVLMIPESAGAEFLAGPRARSQEEPGLPVVLAGGAEGHVSGTEGGPVGKPPRPSSARRGCLHRVEW